MTTMTTAPTALERSNQWPEPGGGAAGGASARRLVGQRQQRPLEVREVLEASRRLAVRRRDAVQQQLGIAGAVHELVPIDLAPVLRLHQAEEGLVDSAHHLGVQASLAHQALELLLAVGHAELGDAVQLHPRVAEGLGVGALRGVEGLEDLVRGLHLGVLPPSREVEL